MTTRRVFDNQRGLVTVIFLASLFVNLLILTAPLYMLQLFTRVMSSGSIPTLMMLTVGAVIALTFYFAFDSIRQLLMSRLGTRLEAELGPVLLNSIVSNSEVALRHGVRPIRDLQDLRVFVTSPYFTALLDAPWAIIFVAVIFMFHPILGMVAVVGITILFALGVVSEIFGRDANKQASETTGSATKSAQEIMRNGDLVRAMGAAPALIDRWQGQSLKALLFGTKATDRVAIMSSLAKSMRLFLQIAVLGVGVILVLAGEIGPGVMIASSILLGRAAAPVEQSIAGWRALMETRLSVANLNTVLATIEAEDRRMELPRPSGRLSVENATVVFPGVQDPILFDASFSLTAGSSLGLIGPSGAGKTTLARAIVGLQPLARGYVRFDDADLQEWPAHQIAQHIGFLPQRVELFEGTVAENIALMDQDADPAMVIEAAKAACVHELILGLPNGYNTEVGPGGEHLSAGQRQRIGLARAFFGDRRVIVLDEPNANLDPSGEEALAQAVANATARGAVVILVTHRMNILQRVSHAAVLDKGRIIRFGAAREVLDAIVQPVASEQSGDDTKIATLRPKQAAAGGAR